MLWRSNWVFYLLLFLSIGDMIPLIGGIEYTEYILDILEKLCTIQEVSVRDAVESVFKNNE